MIIQDTIEITITKEDAEKAKCYSDNDNCLLATALKRVFPEIKSKAYPYTFTLNGTRYFFKNEFKEKIQNSYDYENNYGDMIDLENFKPITFTATTI